MKTYFECLPCFVNQAIGLLKRSGATYEQTSDIMRAVFWELSGIDYNKAPPFTAQKINRIVSKGLDIKDPYLYHKKQYNQIAYNLLSSLQSSITLTDDIFATKVKLAIAANIIDFGKNVNLREEDVLKCFKGALEKEVDMYTLSKLKEEIAKADSILYLCDNAGEIVFDRWLIEEMPLQKVVCAVRGAPVINDATMDDAKEVGLTDIVKVISNGSDAPGTVLEDCSEEFKDYFYKADIIIAKGQGNFETLSDIKKKRIFYLFQVKCPVVERDCGYPVGSFVIMSNQ